MLPLAFDTLRRTTRAPGTWILLALGLVAGWAGFALALLALGELGKQEASVVESTALTWGVLIALQALARTLEQDESSALTASVDATRPGVGGRRLGRWLGATAAGVLAALFLSTALIAASDAGWGRLLRLHVAIISIIPWAVAWGLLWGVLAGARGVLGGGLLLWILGHLPWGSSALLPGPLGRTLHALLPDPTLTATADWLSPGPALATAGLLVVALALGRPPHPAGSGHRAACG